MLALGPGRRPEIDRPALVLALGPEIDCPALEPGRHLEPVLGRLGRLGRQFLGCQSDLATEPGRRRLAPGRHPERVLELARRLELARHRHLGRRVRRQVRRQFL